jgi:hypothetical protein
MFEGVCPLMFQPPEWVCRSSSPLGLRQSRPPQTRHRRNRRTLHLCGFRLRTKHTWVETYRHICRRSARLLDCQLRTSNNASRLITLMAPRTVNSRPVSAPTAKARFGATREPRRRSWHPALSDGESPRDTIAGLPSEANATKFLAYDR